MLTSGLYRIEEELQIQMTKCLYKIVIDFTELEHACVCCCIVTNHCRSLASARVFTACHMLYQERIRTGD